VTTIKLDWNCLLHCVPEKNDTDVGRYNIDVHQLIFVICGENVVKRVHHQMAVLFPTSSNNVSALRGKT